MRFTQLICRPRRTHRDIAHQECGASLTETALTIALVAAAGLLSITLLGTNTESTLRTAGNSINCDSMALNYGGGTGGTGGSIAQMGSATPGLVTTGTLNCNARGLVSSEMPGSEGDTGVGGDSPPGSRGSWGFTD